MGFIDHDEEPTRVCMIRDHARKENFLDAGQSMQANVRLVGNTGIHCLLPKPNPQDLLTHRYQN